MVSTITDSGALSISTDNTANDSVGNITRTATSTLTGVTSVALTTGVGSIGTNWGQRDQSGLGTERGDGDHARWHGRVWLTDTGALTLGAITTTGGNVNVRTTGAGRSPLGARSPLVVAR